MFLTIDKQISAKSRISAAVMAAPAIVLAFGAIMATSATAIAQSSASVSGLEEIIVTARKRSESLQEVPATINVFRGSDLLNAGVFRPSELQYAVPGFYVQNYESRATITMRGVGAQIEGGTSAVATHINGIYQASSAAQLNRLYDIERVEVVKGPQGTLYGRNSTGGAINIITRSAADKFEADASVGYGTDNTRTLDGGLSAPLADGWGLRIAGSYAKSDPIFANTLTGRKIGNDDFWGMRSVLTGGGTNFKVEAFAQYAHDNDDRNITLIPLQTGTKVPLLGYYTTAFDDPQDSVQQRRIFLTGLTLSGDLGNELSWRTITGYQDYRELSSATDANPRPSLANRLSISFPQFDEQFSQEFQLLYNNQDLNWVLGAYYLDDQASAKRLVIQRPANLTFFNNSTADTAKAKAIFGDLNYNLTDQLRLNLGARWNREKIRNSQSGTGAFDAAAYNLPGTQGKNTGRLGLDYQIENGPLVYASVSNGYLAGRFTPRVDSVTGISKPSEVKPEKILAYEAGLKSALPDGRGFFNLAAFYYDYSDIQVTVGGLFLLTNGQPDPARPPFFYTDNAAKSRIYGLDAQLSEVRLNEHIKFDASAAYLSAKYQKYSSVLSNRTVAVFDGNTMPRSPKFTSTAAVTLDNLSLGSSALASVKLEYNYRSKTFFTRENTAVSSQDGYGLINAVARVEFENGLWGAQLTGRNLADKRYFNFLRNDPFGTAGEASNFMFSLFYKFR